MSGALLVQALRAPESLGPGTDWTSLISAARAEQIAGTLAFRLRHLDLPPKVAEVLAGQRADAERTRVQALWEAEMARRALAPLGIPVILLKGTAFVAAGLDAGIGRNVGDLDILVPRARIGEAEAALVAAGWERLKAEESYDDHYYREWMHELPPLIHRERDRMIDVHHTILPPTARPKPDAEALIAASLPLDDTLRILSPEDMIVHAVAHLIADGDLAGGIRNLWDIDRLVRQFAADPGFWPRLHERAAHHQLVRQVYRAARLSAELYDTPIPETWRVWDSADPLFKARLLARNGWGEQTRSVLRFGFYVRSHWMRMPPLMLARHLWVKARKGGA